MKVLISLLLVILLGFVLVAPTVVMAGGPHRYEYNNSRSHNHNYDRHDRAYYQSRHHYKRHNRHGS